MSQRDGQPDGQRPGTHVSSFGLQIGEHSEDNNECDHELHPERLAEPHLVVDPCEPQTAMDDGRRDPVQDPRTCDRTHALCSHVEDATQHGYVPRHQHGERHGRIKMSAADMSNTLHQCSS